MADNQKRPRGICLGCGRKRPIIDVKHKWCDACRKKVARQLLGARGRPDPHLAPRGKLFKIDAEMKRLIAALGDIGVSEEVIIDIRNIVEPFLAPIAVPLGIARPTPKRRPKPEATPEPKPKPKKVTTPEFRSRKAWASHNHRRKGKGLPPLTKEEYLAGKR